MRPAVRNFPQPRQGRRWENQLAYHRRERCDKAAQHPGPGTCPVDPLPVQGDRIGREEGTGQDAPGIGHHVEDRRLGVGDDIGQQDKHCADPLGQPGGRRGGERGLQPRLHPVHGQGGGSCDSDGGEGGHRRRNEEHQHNAQQHVGQMRLHQHVGHEIVRIARAPAGRGGQLGEKQVGKGADEVAAPRHDQREEGGNDGAPLHLPVIPDAIIFMDHLGEAPGAEGGHQHRRPQPGMIQRAEVQLFGLGRHGSHPCLQAAHLIAADDGDDQHRNADQHHQPLHEIRLEGRGIAAQHHHNQGRRRDDHHADAFVHLEEHRADAGQPLIHRSGIGEQENKNHKGSEQLHPPACEPLIKKLRHGFDLQSAGGGAGAPGQDEPGKERTGYRIAHARKDAPQAVFPSRPPRVADEHHRRKVRGAVRERRHPGPCVPPADGKIPHAFRPAAAEQADSQHKGKVHPNGDPDDRLAWHGHSSPQLLYHFKP